MWVVIEWSGFYEGLTFSLDEEGEVRKWKTYQDAVDWAKEYCAFDWKVVSLTGKE